MKTQSVAAMRYPVI